MSKVSLQENEVRYPFEKIQGLLYKQALKIRQLFPNKYEIDELVNEVWLKGSIQKLSNPKYIATRAYWDMIDYIRSIEGGQFMRIKSKNPRPKHLTNFHGYEMGVNPDDDDNDLFQRIPSSYGQEGMKRIDDEDEVNNLLKTVTHKRRLLLEQYFLKEMTLVEIGEITGNSDSCVCTKKTEAITAIRKWNNIVVKKKATKKVKNEILEQILPEYVSDYEIENNNADLLLSV